MADIFRINQGPNARETMHRLAELAVIKNGGEPIPANPEDVIALQAAQENLLSAGIYTGPCAVKGNVEVTY